jgi:S1-C subfamily serine protease
MNSPVRFILGIAFFALLLVNSVASFYVWLYPPGSHGGWYWSGGFGEFQVSKIDPQGPAQELRPGDKIIAINGVNAREHADVLRYVYRLAPGSPFSMTVERNGQEMTFA